MLVVSRKENEVLRIGDARVMVVEIRGNQVRLGIEAPRDVPISREDPGRPAPRQHGVEEVVSSSPTSAE